MAVCTHFQHAVVRTKQIPWTRGTCLARNLSRCTATTHRACWLFFSESNRARFAGVQKPVGAAHACVVAAGFGHEHGDVFEGDCLVEAGGITHQPFTEPNGRVLLGNMFGPTGGFEDARKLADVLDIRRHYQTAKEDGAAGHISQKSKALGGPHIKRDPQRLRFPWRCGVASPSGVPFGFLKNTKW